MTNIHLERWGFAQYVFRMATEPWGGDAGERGNGPHGVDGLCTSSAFGSQGSGAPQSPLYVFLPACQMWHGNNTLEFPRAVQPTKCFHMHRLTGSHRMAL